MNKKFSFALITATSLWIYCSNNYRASAEDDNEISSYSSLNSTSNTSTADSQQEMFNSINAIMQSNSYERDRERRSLESKIQARTQYLALKARTIFPSAYAELSQAKSYSAQVNNLYGLNYSKTNQDIVTFNSQYVIESQYVSEVIALGNSAADPESDQANKSEYLYKQSQAMDNVRSSAVILKSMADDISSNASFFSNANAVQKSLLNSQASSSIRVMIFGDSRDEENEDRSYSNNDEDNSIYSSSSNGSYDEQDDYNDDLNGNSYAVNKYIYGNDQSNNSSLNLPSKSYNSDSSINSEKNGSKNNSFKYKPTNKKTNRTKTVTKKAKIKNNKIKNKKLRKDKNKQKHIKLNKHS